ncbi:MvaI/BcnI family restriction endonuclease [Peribacillus sp. FSL P2-0133]|uniref:MvaI/BcnI family restriction endonuclease n=1 Tax=Peribacillus sp. FSL P2-0133 TaxID=2921573 RepID=UPI0030D2B11E
MTNLFRNSTQIEDVFCKVLAPNDDSGRHGVLIPVFAYRMFPNFNGFQPNSKMNYEETIVTYWQEDTGFIAKQSKWKHYHRYPERRMTSLSPKFMNNKIEGSLLIVGKYKDSFEYECFVIAPNNSIYSVVGDIFKLSKKDDQFTGSAILPMEEILNGTRNNEALEELICMLKGINARGFIETMKNGDTGVGFTFEALIGIRANSGKDPDYKGIEVKCSRSKQPKDKRKASSGKQTLFSLVPKWSIVGSRRGLIEQYGHIDEERERIGLYCTIKIVPNSYLWHLEISEPNQRIYICQNGTRVIFYEMEDLRSALESKHKESFFVTAHARKNVAGNEEFHYDSAVHCNLVSFDEFLRLIKENLAGLDFAIHLKNGKVRDHGFLWRLENRKYLLRLFNSVQEVL